MEKFRKLLEEYFKLPYRPEHLLIKVREELKDHNFNLIKEESKYKIIDKNYKNVFVRIFGENYEKNKYEFNKKVLVAKSYENFQNLVYEECKYKTIDKEKIIIYLFMLDYFKKKIINAIYYSTYDFNYSFDIYDNIFYYISKKFEFSRKKFDEAFYLDWLKNKVNKIKKKNKKNKEVKINKFNKNKKDISNNEKINDTDINNKNEINLFTEENIKINLIKYEYFGPSEAKNNYVLNGLDESKITLFSPGFLIEKGFSKEYCQNDFQVFNENNECINIFKYMLNDSIKELNNKIQNNNDQNNENNNIIVDDNDNKLNDLYNEKMVHDVDIMVFNDKSVGLYLNIINPSHYYETKNLIEQFVANDTKEYKIEQVEFTCSNATNNFSIKEDNNITQQQDFYINYNSFVSEEQIANAIMSSINDDFFNQDIERLPRVIFYTNLFIFKSPEGKEKISLVKKQKKYGFDEADGTFYINNEDVIINKNDSVPFIKTMTFDLYNKKTDNKIHYKENEINSKIILKKNSFVYMEVKLSFPLKFDEKTGEPKAQSLEDFSNLIRSIIRKSKKFCEIAIKKEKKVEQIHILLFYDFMIQSNQYAQRTLDIFKEKIFSKIEIYFSLIHQLLI